MKKFLAICLAVAFALACVGCSSVNSLMRDSSSTPASSAPQAPQSAGSENTNGADEDYYHEGRMGDVMSNVFFDFTVDSAQWVDEYNGYTAAEGNALVDTVITVKNTFGEALPMSIYDFQIQWGAGDEDYGYQKEEWEGGELMPTQWEIKPAQTVTYHVVYEVPADTTDFSISYLELFDDESEGNVFFVYFELDPYTSGVNA